MYNHTENMYVTGPSGQHLNWTQVQKRGFILYLLVRLKLGNVARTESN